MVYKPALQIRIEHLFGLLNPDLLSESGFRKVKMILAQKNFHVLKNSLEGACMEGACMEVVRRNNTKICIKNSKPPQKPPAPPESSSKCTQ
jgi:hypothetical protein